MNLSRIIERHAQFSPRQVAIHFEGRDISYPQLWQDIERATVILRDGLPTAAPGKAQKRELLARAGAG